MEPIIETHPWITFDFRLDALRPHHWLVLGECCSKIEHIVGTPLTPRVEQELDRVYVSRGLWGTAAIEGNTLTEEEVEKRLQGKLELPPSQEYLGREIDNLARAYDLVTAGIQDHGRAELTEEQTCEFNRMILDGLPLEDDVLPGVYAVRQHGVGRYRAPSPEAIRQLMPRYIAWLNSPQWNEMMSHRLAGAIVRAILAHLYLAWIHPFGDGNGRTARLVEADLLARAGVPEISYHLLSTHYNRTRGEYYRVLAQTSARTTGDCLVFLEYALNGLAEGLRQQVKAIKAQHREIIWHDFVHSHFRGQNTPRYVRLRGVAIDLAEERRPVPVSELRRISPRVAEAYASKTGKTLTRDIKELMKRGLIKPVKGGFVANTAQLRAFVPIARQQED